MIEWKIDFYKNTFDDFQNMQKMRVQFQCKCMHLFIFFLCIMFYALFPSTNINN